MRLSLLSGNKQPFQVRRVTPNLLRNVRSKDCFFCGKHLKTSNQKKKTHKPSCIFHPGFKKSNICLKLFSSAYAGRTYAGSATVSGSGFDSGSGNSSFTAVAMTSNAWPMKSSKSGMAFLLLYKEDSTGGKAYFSF